MSKKRMALGKGLNALLQDAGQEVRASNQHDDSINHFMEIPVTQIERNKAQPREEFDEEALEELSESIKIHGLIQPITVRKIARSRYQIISGERRYRASLKANIERIPAYVRMADDKSTLEMALVENIQREDLNAMEIANSYQRLIEECELKQEELGSRVGKKRSTVTNYLRLLKLPTELQIALRANLIRMGHARALLPIEDTEVQKKLLEDVLENDLSVRQVEKMVKDLLENPQPAGEEKSPRENKSGIHNSKPDYDRLLWEEKLSSAYNRNVKIKLKANGKGEILVPFTSEDDLQEIMRIVGKKR